SSPRFLAVCRRTKRAAVMLSLLRPAAFYLKSFVWIHLVAAGYFLWEVALRAKSWFIPNAQLTYSPVKKATAVVTGGSKGLGYETTRSLLSLGIRVIVGSSSPKRAATAKQHLLERHPNSQVEFLPLDLRSMSSVKTFAEEVISRSASIDLLICNAGVMMVPYSETEDGFESHLSVNYLGHCLLTALLLPRLASAGTTHKAARIVNVTSCVHKAASISFNDLQSKRWYSPYHGYAQSKLAQVMFTESLARHLHSQGLHVTVNCVHPGIVDTDLYQMVSWSPLVSGLFFRTPTEGAETTLYAALSPAMEGVNGCYLEDCALANPSFEARDHASQDRLWKETWTCLQPWLTEATSPLFTKPSQRL
ncbi:unnamed protein product, partial [Ixodes hexagonus]